MTEKIIVKTNSGTYVVFQDVEEIIDLTTHEETERPYLRVEDKDGRVIGTMGGKLPDPDELEDFREELEGWVLLNDVVRVKITAVVEAVIPRSYLRDPAIDIYIGADKGLVNKRDLGADGFVIEEL